MERKLQFNNVWYPTKKEEIKKFLPQVNKLEKIDAISCICPHAGWIYSGYVAGEVYSLINPADLYVLLGPNHTGLGKEVSLFDSGFWEGPLGKINIDTDFVQLLLKNSEFLEKDVLAHYREHSLEVQIPFLQFITQKNFNIVPIIIRSQEYQICNDIGNSIASAIKKYKEKFPEKKVVLIASTDMTHYEPKDYAVKLDTMAIEQIIKLSAKGLYDTVLTYGISMCGVIPTVCVIIASKILGAKSAKLIKYQTSGDVNGDYAQVVGYAGIIIS